MIARVDHYTKRKVREAMEIEKHPTNINKDDGRILRKTWCPVINLIKNKHNTTIIDSMNMLHTRQN